MNVNTSSGYEHDTIYSKNDEYALFNELEFYSCMHELVDIKCKPKQSEGDKPDKEYTLLYNNYGNIYKQYT